MSWSKSYKSRAEFDSDKKPPENLGDRQVEQFDVARRVAVQLLDSGVVGSQDTDVSVSLYGHTNQEPGAGDSLGVSIAAVVAQ